MDRQSDAQDEALERIEDARSEAAAYVIQSQPAPDSEFEDTEERMANAIQEAEQEDDPAKLEGLADRVEAGRDAIRNGRFGTDRERDPG